MTHAHLYHEPLPSEALLFDGTTYDLGWDGSRTTPDPDVPVLPTYDHALYLINAVKFRCGQMYHLFDDDDFMACLHRFYSEPRGTATASLWYIHFHLVLAFGKGFVQQKSQGKRPPGSEFFSKALRLLPDPCSLWYNPIESTEILCCISLYYQSLDCRQAAHSYVCPSPPQLRTGQADPRFQIGQAMRLAMAQGMHTRMPAESLGENMVQRCRKIWWTIYILDREMTSLMGLPQSINDDHVHTDLPVFPGSVLKTASLHMHIKLSRITAEINSSKSWWRVDFDRDRL